MSNSNEEDESGLSLSQFWIVFAVAVIALSLTLARIAGPSVMPFSQKEDRCLMIRQSAGQDAELYCPLDLGE